MKEIQKEAANFNTISQRRQDKRRLVFLPRLNGYMWGGTS